MIHPPDDEALERLWYAREKGRAVEFASPDDEERARGIVRRHRLAEILFAQVLEVDLHDAEQSACEIEHTLTERVVDSVCTFLGHPPACPHGKPVPQGSCCKVYSRKVEPLVTRLIDLPIGASACVVFIAPKSLARVSRLASFGLVPGSEIRLLERKPSVVLSCGQTSIAVEDEIGREIYVRAM